MKNVFSLKMLIAFFLVVYCIQGSALAQENETEVLQTKVEKLQQKVAQLESRVAQLEKVLLSNKNSNQSSQYSVSVTPKKWKNKQNWRKLEIGMSKAEVKEILGEPESVSVMFGTERWDYEVEGIGWVDFYGDDGVTGWVE